MSEMLEKEKPTMENKHFHNNKKDVKKVREIKDHWDEAIVM